MSRQRRPSPSDDQGRPAREQRKYGPWFVVFLGVIAICLSTAVGVVGVCHILLRYGVRDAWTRGISITGYNPTVQFSTGDEAGVLEGFANFFATAVTWFALMVASFWLLPRLLPRASRRSFLGWCRVCAPRKLREKTANASPETNNGQRGG